jgi:hypothetical protein
MVMDEGYISDRSQNVLLIPTWIKGKPEHSLWLTPKRATESNTKFGHIIVRSVETLSLLLTPN